MGTIVIWLNVELILSLDIMITYEQDTDLRSKTELYFVSEVLCYLLMLPIRSHLIALKS